MATKKKSRKKPAKAKVSARKKAAPLKKKAARKPPVAKRRTVAKKVAKKKTVTKKKPAAKKSVAKKPAGRKPAAKKPAMTPAKKLTKKRRGKRLQTFSLDTPDLRSGRQSGDLQGLSNVADADSESVDELAEEGNSFEASVLSGVEAAGDGRSVRTHQVPEDDVPEEYLDKD